VKPRENVIAKMVGTEMVLLDYDRGIYYGLNPVGARVWQLLRDGATPDEIVAQLTDEYDVAPATLQADVAALLRDLEAKELVD
jgi:hypothetical protein